MKTTSELQIEYDTLLSEYKTLKKLIDDAEAAKKRLGELKPTSIFNKAPGLLAKVKQELEDSKYPIFEVVNGPGSGTNRIIDVNEKWISIKHDGNYTPTRYKRDTGWKERSRDGYFHIDHIKALEIWEKFQAKRIKNENTRRN